MKKILFTVTNDLTFDRRMIRIGESLVQAGYEITLLGRELKTSQLFDNQWIKPVRLKLFFQKGKLFYLEYNLRLLIWLLRNRQFEIVCGIDLDSIVACYFAVKIKNILRGGKNPIQLVYDAHELFSETPEVVRRPAIKWLWRRIESFIVPRVPTRYTVSQGVADEFFRRYQQPFEVIRNLPTRDSYLKIEAKSRRSHSSKIILYQGALNEGRGLEIAIAAMQQLENAELWLIGEGDLSDSLRQMTDELGLSEKVKFWGFIKPDELPNFTIQADIGFNILEDKGLSYRYSLANKFLDYIQAELPQIFIQFPEYQRINAAYNIGVGIEKCEVEPFVEAVKRLLEDADFYQLLKKNCQKAAEELCWEKEEKRLIELYSRLNRSTK